MIDLISNNLWYTYIYGYPGSGVGYYFYSPCLLVSYGLFYKPEKNGRRYQVTAQELYLDVEIYRSLLVDGGFVLVPR